MIKNGIYKSTDAMEEEIKKMIEESVLLIFKRENIIPFLRSVSQNYLQDYRNQILIWRQRSKGAIAAGRSAIEKLGLRIREGVRPITILYPMVVCVDEGRLVTEGDGCPVMRDESFVYEREPEFVLCYRTVSAYDILDDVEEQGEIPLLIKDIDIYNAVRGNIAFVVESIQEEIRGKGAVDYVNGRFILREGLTDRERDRIMLELYADYFVQICLRDEVFFKERLSDKGWAVLAFLLKGALLAGFGELTEEFSLIPFSEAEAIGADERMILLECLNLGLQEAMGRLVGGYLSFDETALCNSLLRQDKEGRVVNRLFEAEYPFRRRDAYIDHVMKKTGEKLRKGNCEQQNRLCSKVRNQSLMSYPPYPFP